MNLLKGNEKSTTMFILACLQRFFPNFHHAHFKVLQRKFHNARLFHHARLLFFFNKFHYARLFHHARLLDTSE